MMRSRHAWLKPILIGASVFVLATVGVIYAIRFFGAEEVQAFAGTMSFVAVAGAAILTARYVIVTQDIAAATRENAAKQGRIAELMESDLLFRVKPHLKYKAGQAPGLRQEGHICNVGRGPALDVKVKVKHLPSNREEEIMQIPELECDGERRIDVTRRQEESGFEIVFICTDSLRLSDYSFSWNHGGEPIRREDTPRLKSEQESLRD